MTDQIKKPRIMNMGNGTAGSVYVSYSIDSNYKLQVVKRKLKNYVGKMEELGGSAWKMAWKVGREDPRRLVHSLKVGLSLTLVSLLYLTEPLFKDIGQNAIWAVMTVVVVLEFTAGATLCKGLNRGLGTLLAGSLAFIVEFVASKTGHLGRAIFIGAAVFVIGAAATYVRFFPYIKKNFDYGVVIFLLTFNLITISSYRVTNVLNIAHERLTTISVGCGICLFMTLLVFPIWSGHDLHNSTVFKLEGLARSIQACVNEYFDDPSTEEEGCKNDRKDATPEDPIIKAVLDSKSADETLAMYASWEPRHSRYCYKLPCQQYVEVGAALRHFGYTIVSLHGCLQTEIQTPKCVRALFKDPCVRLAEEVSRVLMELANSIRDRRHCSPEILSDHLHEALKDLDTALKSQPRLFLGSCNNQANILALAAGKKSGNDHNVSIPSFKTDTSAILLELKTKHQHHQQQLKEGERKMLRPTLSKIAMTSLEFAEALPFAAFASLLVETVARLDHVIDEVEELGNLSHFKEYEEKQPQPPGQEDEVIVTCEKLPVRKGLANNLPFQGDE